MQHSVKRRQFVSQFFDSLEARRLYAFGVTTGTAATGQPTYVIDNGADLKFAVIRGGSVSNTLHIADVNSIQYKGKEVLAPYSTTSRYSHYEQGLGNDTQISYVVNSTAGWIMVKCVDVAVIDGVTVPDPYSATQYYMVRRNDNNLYMASLPTDVGSGPGEGRFIAYLSRNVFPNPEKPSDNNGNTGAIEGGDVFGYADGTTSSKFYNMGRRMIENDVHGVVGNASGTPVGAFMNMGNRERSAGGAFFKDIDMQSGSAVELYNCIFTGHTQTEAYRQGLHWYAMQFTSGAVPAAPDYSWFDTVTDSSGNSLISGYVPTTARGMISGVATGNPAGSETVVTLSNAAAQYWDMADASGNYVISGVLPGTYTETMYRDEIAVGTRTVTIAAGQNTRANITSTYYTPAPTWRMGTWDGTPIGFLNAEIADAPTGARKIEIYHPSDVRMSSWVLPADPVTGVPTFNVGTDTDSEWPMVQFMGVNNSNRIAFNLTAAQAAQAQTLRIGITLGFEGGRNRVTVNGGRTDVTPWTSAIPTASRDLNSRGITRGTYRGDNQLYTYNIPTSALKAGANYIDLGVVSGSFVAGQTWLSPNVAYDAIDLVPTSSVAAPTVASLAVTPANGAIALSGTRTFTATARTAAGAVLGANVIWTAARGTINDAGEYVAPATAGPDTITATSGAVSGSTTINVLASGPAVNTAASASPNPVYGKTTTLSALGADLTGEANLTYTWSVLGTPPASVTFAAVNGTNAGKSTLATFATPGDYSFRVTITNAAGQSVTSDTAVTVYDKKVWYRVNASSGTTLVDSSGGNNTATLTGAYSYAAGVEGNALKLTGGAATLPTGVVSSLNDFTIGAWVKPDASQSWARLFDFGTGTNNYMFFSPRTATGVSRFAIRTATTAEQTIDGPALAVGAWTHVAVTLSGNTATFYVNGIAIGTNTNMTLRPSSLGTTTANYIGDSQFTADPNWLASVDDFRIYGYGLTAADVGTWMNSVAPPTVTAMQIDDGTNQRSSVRSIKLTFSQPVTLEPSDLTLLLAGGATTTALAITPTGTAGTQFVVGFSGNGTTGGSLLDGRYQLVVNGASVLNLNGIAMATSPAYNFFRLYGDIDGNATVNFNDFLSFQTAFGSTTGTSAFMAGFDEDDNGVIDFNDFLDFQTSFGKTI